MDRLVLDHFQWFMVVLYYNIPAVEIVVEILQTKSYQKTLLLNVHIVSLNVSKHFTGES